MSSRTSRCASSAARIRVRARATCAGCVRGARHAQDRGAHGLRGGRGVGEQVRRFLRPRARAESGGGHRLQVVLDLAGKVQRCLAVGAVQAPPGQLLRVLPDCLHYGARSLRVRQRIGATHRRALRVAGRSGHQIGARIGRGARRGLRRKCRVLSGHLGPPVLGYAGRSSFG